MNRSFRALLGAVLIALPILDAPARAATSKASARPVVTKKRSKATKPAPIPRKKSTKSPRMKPEPTPDAASKKVFDKKPEKTTTRRRQRLGKNETPRIRRVRIIRRDIFDTRIAEENTGLFRTVNALHCSTKEIAIRGQLLLKEGDRYNADLAKESERALRGILRLRNVKVTPVPVKDGAVDLLVTVQETWTTEPVFSMSGVGSSLKMKAGLREKNLFGLGKKASYFYIKDAGVVSRMISYDDPRLMGTPLTMSGDYQDWADGHTRALVLEKPFSSTVTRWNARGEYADIASTVSSWDDNGEDLDDYILRRWDANASIGVSAGSTTRRVIRPRVNYRRIKLQRERLPMSLLEEDKLFHIFGLGIELGRVNYLTVNHVKSYERDEDISLGPTVDIEGGAARKKWVRTSDNADFYKGKFGAGQRFGPSHFGLLTASGEGRAQDRRWRSTRLGADAEYYNHFQPRQTLAGHIGWAEILNPSPIERLTLGGDSGLRGYKINQFWGNKRVVANIENRFFVIDDVGRFASIGAVVFADAGNVWRENRSLRMKDFKSDVGAGLRLYLNRTSQGHVLRFDLAYALRRVDTQSRLVFTFGSSHAF